MQNTMTMTGTRRRTVTRTRVKSRTRFITFLIIVIGLIVGALGFVTGMNDSTASETDDYISYTVESGDTLWAIADSVNTTNTDTRKIVHAICLINDIQADDLQPGMILTLPAEM